MQTEPGGGKWLQPEMARGLRSWKRQESPSREFSEEPSPATPRRLPSGLQNHGNVFLLLPQLLALRHLAAAATGEQSRVPHALPAERVWAPPRADPRPRAHGSHRVPGPRRGTGPIGTRQGLGLAGAGGAGAAPTGDPAAPTRVGRARGARSRGHSSGVRGGWTAGSPGGRGARARCWGRPWTGRAPRPREPAGRVRREQGGRRCPPRVLRALRPLKRRKEGGRPPPQTSRARICMGLRGLRAPPRDVPYYRGL